MFIFSRFSSILKLFIFPKCSVFNLLQNEHANFSEALLPRAVVEYVEVCVQQRSACAGSSSFVCCILQYISCFLSFPFYYIFFLKMASGMPVNEDCVTTFNELKLRHAFKWIIFKIDHDEIVVEKKGSSGAADFSKELPASDCRYAVYDEGKDAYLLCFAFKLAQQATHTRAASCAVSGTGFFLLSPLFVLREP